MNSYYITYRDNYGATSAYSSTNYTTVYWVVCLNGFTWDTAGVTGQQYIECMASGKWNIPYKCTLCTCCIV